jgi:hypothetical protein
LKPAVYLFVLLAICLPVLVRDGLTVSTTLVLLVVAGVLSIPLYFGTRNREQPPTRGESFAASAWVWLRRVVGVGTGLLLLAVVAFGVLRLTRQTPLQEWLYLGIALLLGLFFMHVGIYGRQRGASGRGDQESHEENKRRYGWRR